MNKEPKRDLIGKIFGRLNVVDLEKIDINGKMQWRFKCLCNCQKDEENKKYCYVRRDHLINGEVTSCGCYAIEASKEREVIDIVGNKF